MPIEIDRAWQNVHHKRRPKLTVAINQCKSDEYFDQTRTLSKRLERLETRMMPTDEPLVVQIQFVSPDGSVEDGPRISVPGAGGRRVGKGPR